MDTVNYFLERKQDYQEVGRNKIGGAIRNILYKNNVKYVNTYSSPDVAK